MTVVAMASSTFPAPMRALIRKEFREYRNHRAILLTALGLPLVFMFLPFIHLLGVPADASQAAIDLAAGQAMFTFFLTPVIVPAALAAYSIIGEKEQGTLEPLLTLPLTDRQFIHGKIVAIVAPAAIVSILVYAGFYLAGLALIHGPHRDETLDPIWIPGIVGMAAPLALYSTLVGMTISARARDLRVAEQLAGMVILPTLVPIALITFKVVPVNLATWGVFLALVAVIDAVLLALAYRMFQRERVVALAG